MRKLWAFAAVTGIGVASFAASGARAAPPEELRYVGSANCKKCHLKEFKSWEKTPMAKAFDALKPGAGKEAREKGKLELAKDYTKDASCLPCHTTGYGKPGGYPRVGDADQALAAERLGVQCETCHGPGSQYSPYMKEHEKDYKTEEAKKLGLVFSDGTGCTECHKGGPGGAPTLPADYKFDGAAKLKAEAGSGVHAHFKKP